MSRECKATEQNIERECELLSELRCYRAIESERIKWKAKEARLIAQLEVQSTREVARETVVRIPVVTSPSTTAASITSWGEPVPSQVLNSALELERSAV